MKSKWESFYEANPLFDKVETQAKVISSPPKAININLSVEEIEKIVKIQRFWRKLLATNISKNEIKVLPGVKHRSKQMNFITNIKSKDEIKQSLLSAVETKKVNTDEVKSILYQYDAPRCIYELFHEGKISREERSAFLSILTKLPEEHLIYKSVDTIKIKNLRALIDNGLKNTSTDKSEDLYSELKAYVQDKNFPKLVIGLLDSIHADDLQLQQIFSLLELHQTTLGRKYINEKNLKESLVVLSSLLEIYPVLDKQGEFTPQAKDILLAALKQETSLQVHFLEKYDDTNKAMQKRLEEFKSLIALLPQSEQFFYTIQIPSYSSKLTNSILIEKTFLLQPTADKKYNIAIVPSCGLRNAIGLMRYGKNYVPLLPQFGIKSMSGIENGIRNYHARLGYLYYPNTPVPVEVHNSRQDTYFGIFMHDQYHSDVASSMPKFVREGLLRLVDVTRKSTGIHWSKEIWVWTDADFRYFKTNNFNSQLESGMYYFCSMLDTSQSFSQDPYGQIFNTGQTITTAGALIIFDMVKNKQEWVNIGLDPDRLPSDMPRAVVTKRAFDEYGYGDKILCENNYLIYYKTIKDMIKLCPEILDMSPRAQVIQLYIYLAFRVQLNEKIIKNISEFITVLDKNDLIKFSKDKGNTISISVADNIIAITKKGKYEELSPLKIVFDLYNTFNIPWCKDDFIKIYNAVKSLPFEILDLYCHVKNTSPIVKQIITAVLFKNTLQNTEFCIVKSDIKKNFNSQDFQFFCQPILKDKKQSDMELKILLQKLSKDDNLDSINSDEIIDHLKKYHSALIEEERRNEKGSHKNKAGKSLKDSFLTMNFK